MKKLKLEVSAAFPCSHIQVLLEKRKGCKHHVSMGLRSLFQESC